MSSFFRDESLRVVLITGCSSGIGLACARAFLSTPYRLVLTSPTRSFDILEREFSQCNRVVLRPMDVTDQTQVSLVLREISRRWGGIDVLVNNAGTCIRGALEEATEEDLHTQLEVNFFGPMRLCRGVLPFMRKRHKGHIINISSVSGMVAMPTMGIYSASKFALEGATEALWYEVRPWGVKVTLVQPGFVHSESFRRAIMAKGTAPIEKSPYYPAYRAMEKFIERLMLKAWTTPEEIAHLVLRVARTDDPPLRVEATVDAKLFSFLRRVLPRELYHRFLYWALPEVRTWVASAPSTLRDVENSGDVLPRIGNG